MSIALKLYEQLTDVGEDKTRARLIADAFESLEERDPAPNDAATQGALRETELRLLREIKEVELKIAQTEARLTKDIREVEARLAKDIREVDVRLTKEIKDVEVRLVNAIHRQTLWTVGSIGAIIAFIRFLDWVLNKLPLH